MNKVTNINLGGFPFAMDENAYQKMDRYFDAIERHFRNSEGFEEITTDIEYRIAEILNERLGKRQIVTLTDVEEVIAVMGTPEDFGAESMGEPEEKRSSGSTYTYVKTGKRIFRDPDNKVLGGVCSGLSAYFGVHEPLWFRIGFLVLFFAGVTPILYPFLWIVIPMAKTSSDKLAMRGEPINVSNIARTVEEELHELSNKISDLSNELKSKKKEMRRKRRNKAEAI